MIAMHTTRCLAAATSSTVDQPRRGGLLSVEESVARSRQLRSCRSVDLVRLSKSVSAALEEWRRAWQLEDDGLAYPKTGATEQVWCRTLFDDEVRQHVTVSADWQPIANVAAGVWWSLQRSGDAFDRKEATDAMERIHKLLIRTLFGEDEFLGRTGKGTAETRQSGIAADIAHAAWTDWCGRLLRCLNIPESATRGGTDLKEAGLSSTLFDAWAGTAAIIVPWCGQTLLLLIDATRTAQHDLPKSADSAKRVKSGKLIPVLKAVAGSTVGMAVELLPVEIELGMLADLRVGDVLRTPHLLSGQLILKIVEGIEKDDAVGLAFLGRTGDSRAIELAAGSNFCGTQVHGDTAR